VHIERISADTVKLTCSPVSKISILSNQPWVGDRMARGEGLTEFTYTAKPSETYIRAEVTDAEGRTGYSNIIVF
jgi:hypothetical protein